MAGAGSAATSSGRPSFEETAGEDGGAKGGGEARAEGTEYDITSRFAVALCEGEVSRLGRVWADGQLLETARLTLRFYRGTRSAGGRPR